MNYDENMLVELIAEGELSHGRIAERVGVSRRTVWKIANGLSRPDLQRKIAATVEGYRQAAIRAAARHMKALLEKQVQVALEGDGETARKCREFLLKTFMLAIPEQAAKVESQTRKDPPPEPKREQEESSDLIALYNSLTELSPELQEKVIEELCGRDDEIYAPKPQACDPPADPPPEPPPPEPPPEPVDDPNNPGRKLVEDPFIAYRRRLREASEAALEGWE